MYARRGNADRKNIMAGESCDFQPLFNENIVRAVTLQGSHRFFRLHLNDSAPIYFDYRILKSEGNLRGHGTVAGDLNPLSIEVNVLLVCICIKALYSLAGELSVGVPAAEYIAVSVERIVKLGKVTVGVNFNVESVVLAAVEVVSNGVLYVAELSIENEVANGVSSDAGNLLVISGVPTKEGITGLFSCRESDLGLGDGVRGGLEGELILAVKVLNGVGDDGAVAVKCYVLGSTCCNRLNLSVICIVPTVECITGLVNCKESCKAFFFFEVNGSILFTVDVVGNGVVYNNLFHVSHHCDVLSGACGDASVNNHGISGVNPVKECITGNGVSGSEGLIYVGLIEDVRADYISVLVEVSNGVGNEDLFPLSEENKVACVISGKTGESNSTVSIGEPTLELIAVLGRISEENGEILDSIRSNVGLCVYAIVEVILNGVGYGNVLSVEHEVSVSVNVDFGYVSGELSVKVPTSELVVSLSGRSWEGKTGARRAVGLGSEVKLGSAIHVYEGIYGRSGKVGAVLEVSATNVTLTVIVLICVGALSGELFPVSNKGHIALNSGFKVEFVFVEEPTYEGVTLSGGICGSCNEPALNNVLRLYAGTAVSIELYFVLLVIYVKLSSNCASYGKHQGQTKDAKQ